MSYQVIARKYRPQRFADVVGQDHVTDTLANAIRQSRIAHAYLFCGPRGTGKTTIARIFAKCLNCTGGPQVDFAVDDPRAVEIAEGRSIDVIEIDGASTRGIEDIRSLRETVKYAPASSKFKVYIVDEVHMLTKEAFNALLKTLEEPPAHVKFLFATTDPEKVLPTILSRCQRFDLRRIPIKLIVKHLGYIAGQEQVQIEEAALHAVARGADGCLRDAESTLDQLISFCGHQIAEPDVLSMFGLTARNQIFDLTQAILDGDADKALRQFNDLAGQGKDLSRLLSELLVHFRNLLVYQVSRGDLKLLEIPETEQQVLARQVAGLDPESTTRILEALTDGETRLRDAISKKIFLEVTLFKAIAARNAVSIDHVLKVLQQLRADPQAVAAAPAVAAPAASPGVRMQETPPAPAVAPSAPAPARPAPPPPAAAPEAPAPASQPFTAARDVSHLDASLQQLWGDLLAAVKRASPFSYSYLLEADPVSLAKNVLTIGYDPEFAEYLPMVDNTKNHTLLQTKLTELGHPHVQVKFIRLDGSSPKPAPAPRPVAPAPAAAAAAPAPAPEYPQAPAARPEPVALTKEDFKKDPLIQKALEVFKAQIANVRA